ncbi:Kef-type K+ transport systems, membrane components [Thermoplasmatales archaeon BRNA1]|nr:Kef-type K+ transport systems, membrane components [Thermoplasmatales archaeon BRNA1]
MELLPIAMMLVVLFTLARVGNRVFEHFGVPGLIGEIIVGILIANIVIWDGETLVELLHAAVPAVGANPGDLETTEFYSVLYVAAELGVIFLLFSVGLETKVEQLLNVGKSAMLVAVLGVVVPFVLGFAFIMFQDGNFHHAMFLAAAMVATSVGITARVIKDMHLMEKRESRIIIGAAVIDDVLGMIVLAIVKGVAGSDSGVSISSILIIIVEAIGFVLITIWAAKVLVPKFDDWNERRKLAYMEKNKRSPQGYNDLVVALIVCLAFATFAEFIGLAAIIGAFLAGMLFANKAWESGLDKKFETVTTVFISFFFLNVGMQVDASQLSDTTIIIDVVIVIILAVISKFVGCGLGAKLGDASLDKNSVSIIGVGMVPRGEVGIIVASIGLSIVLSDGTQALSGDLYTVIVLMAVATTVIAPPLLTKVFRKRYPEEFSITAGDRI